MSLFSKETLQQAGISTQEYEHPELAKVRKKRKNQAEEQAQAKKRFLEDSSTEHGIVTPSDAQGASIRATAEHPAVDSLEPQKSSQNIAQNGLGKIAAKLEASEHPVHVESHPAGEHQIPS